eukprot:CFRG1539T1
MGLIELYSRNISVKPICTTNLVSTFALRVTKQGPKKAVNNTESNRISERVPSPAHLLLTDDQKASSIRRLLCKTRMRDRGLTHVWSRKLKRKSIPIFEHERAASPVIVLTTEERAAKGRRMRRKTVMRLRGISRVWVKDGRFRSDMALMSSPSGDLTCKEGVARQRRHRRKNILIKRGLSKVWTCARSKRPNIAKKETGNAHETAVHETEALMSGTPTSAN